jgi:hypothetical protein
MKPIVKGNEDQLLSGRLELAGKNRAFFPGKQSYHEKNHSFDRRSFWLRDGRTGSIQPKPNP